MTELPHVEEMGGGNLDGFFGIPPYIYLGDSRSMPTPVGFDFCQVNQKGHAAHMKFPSGQTRSTPPRGGFENRLVLLRGW
jgi:hypothetical protein